MKIVNIIRHGWCLILVSVGLLINLIRDISHPSWWSDWTHDPRLYGPVAIPLFVIFWVLLVCGDYRKNRHVELMCMLTVIKKLLRSGRVREGTEAHLLYYRVKAAACDAEADRLAKQFWDKFRV